MKLCFCAGLMLFSTLLSADLRFQPLTLRTGSDAAQPSVAVDPKFGFVVTWQERGDSVHKLLFALLRADGQEIRRGLIVSGQDWFVNSADFPNLVVLDNGDWLTFWLQKSAPDTYAYDVRAVRSRDAGASWDAPITIHRDRTATEHGFVSIAPAGGSAARLVWLDGRRMANKNSAHGAADEQMTLRTATLTRSGVLRDEQELDELSCSCCQTDVAQGATGTLFAYRGRTLSEVRDISSVLHNGKRFLAPKVVSADGWKIAGCPVNGPALAAQGNRFAVLWPTMHEQQLSIRIAVGDGMQFGAAMVVAAGADELGKVDLASWGEHGFLATRVQQSSGGARLVVDQLDAAGKRLSSATVATKVGGFPRIARSGAVALLIWTRAGDPKTGSQLGALLITAPGRTTEL